MSEQAARVKDSTFGTRIGLFVLGLSISTLVSFTLWMDVVRPSLLANRMSHWQQTPATIVHSSAQPHEDDKSKYQLGLKYSYEFDKKKYLSTWYHVSNPRYESKNIAEIEQEKFPIGRDIVCFVNPGAPEEAIIFRKPIPRSWLFTTGCSLIFLLGLGISFGTIRYSERLKASLLESRQASPLPESGAQYEALVLIAFGLFFSTLGGYALWVSTIAPYEKARSSDVWKPVSCRIVSSEVREHRDRNSTLYSIAIAFEYEHEGLLYQSNSYNFSGGPTISFEDKHQIVQQHPVGLETQCFVDPANPAEAVLARDLGKGFWLMGIAGFVFVIAGLGAVIAGLRLVICKVV